MATQAYCVNCGKMVEPTVEESERETKNGVFIHRSYSCPHCHEELYNESWKK